MVIKSLDGSGWALSLKSKMLDPDPDSMIPDSSDETEKNPE
jgi:hypothetical protein